MKRNIILIILCLPQLLWANINPNGLWQKADSLYTAENYTEAASVYEQIVSEGLESAKLYFNLGNAYYKAGEINKAILNYERAKLLDPADEDIAFNLNLANQFVVTKVEALPQPFFTRWRIVVMNKFTVDTWAYLSISAFWVFLILFGVYLFSRSRGMKKLAFWLGIFVLLLSTVSFSMAGGQKKKLTHRNQAIVFCPRVTVKSSPSDTGTDLFLIYEGLKVEITDHVGEWSEIRLADGNTGWLPDSCIERI